MSSTTLDTQTGGGNFTPIFSSVRIIGSGLIGSSIGLALAAKGIHVEMVDIDPEAQGLARDLIGTPSPVSRPDLIIVASPISTLSDVIKREIKQDFNLGFIDISSVKTNPVLEVSTIGLDMSKFLPSHPMAGREVGGAQSARGDLFEGRAWIIDSSGVSPALLQAGQELISLCGAHLIDMTIQEHDKAVALVSHLPQILSSLLAGALEGAPAHWLDLAGGGLRDTTRIAASSPQLWSEILVANKESLLPLLETIMGNLEDLVDLLNQSEPLDGVEEFIRSGNRGRAMIPGKHGGVARKYSYLPVVIEDKPGQLAALFDECATAQVNVEDLSIEHSPEQYTGLITLALSQSDAEVLHRHLLKEGWKAHSPR